MAQQDSLPPDGGAFAEDSGRAGHPKSFIVYHSSLRRGLIASSGNLCYNTAMNCEMRDNISASYNFRELRTTRGIYVDKTAFLHRLVTWRLKKSFIVTRPRRFGKSLMISTLQHILEGHKELFRGLYIAEKTDYDWPKVPTVSFTLAQVNNECVDALKAALVKMVREAFPERVFDRMPASYQEPEDVFRYAIMHMAAEGKPIAVLIDEYDWPIGHALGNPELAERLREVMYRFYHTLKTREDDICFLMMTGISRFSKLSVFSGLNNLTDLNNDDSFATLFGYTETELDAYFGEHMKAHAEKMGLSDVCYRQELKHWFNGYCFGKESEKVYNPYSIATVLSLKSRVFGSDWSQSGRSTMLVNFLKQNVDCLSFDINGDVYASPDELLNTFDLSGLSPLAMLYQCGYLTVSRYLWDDGIYVLHIPDEEIRRDLNKLLFALYIKKSEADRTTLRMLFYADDMPKFLETLQAHYKALVHGPTEQVQEFSYQRALQFFFLAEGMPVRVETPDCDGKRSDMIVERKNRVYVFEFKVDEGADIALKQILDRDYMGPYRLPGNEITLIGLSFKRDSHKLQEFAIERL